MGQRSFGAIATCKDKDALLMNFLTSLSKVSKALVQLVCSLQSAAALHFRYFLFFALSFADKFKMTFGPELKFRDRHRDFGIKHLWWV
jgi:hypothetical protein